VFGHADDIKTHEKFFNFTLSQVAENISFFFIEIENFRGEGNILMRHTHDTTFSEKILDFYKILEESEQVFILVMFAAI
jgi:hypothetical protein